MAGGVRPGDGSGPRRHDGPARRGRLAGLSLRGVPERRFLLATLALGAFLLAVAHLGPVSSPLAPAAQALLDGPLVAFRNIHKADPLVRLPLAVGVAYALDRWGRAVAARRLAVRLPAWGAVALVVLVAVAPGLSGAIAPRGTFADMARQWREAGAWLSDRAGDGRALVVPASSFGEYDVGPHHRRADPPALERRLRGPRCRAAHPRRHDQGARRGGAAAADRPRRGRGGRRAAPGRGCGTSCCATTSTRHPPASRRSRTPARRSGRRRSRPGQGVRADPHRRERRAGLPRRGLRRRVGGAVGRHPAGGGRPRRVRRAGGPGRGGGCRHPRAGGARR